MENKNIETDHSGKFFTLSEFRHEVGIPLVMAKKLVLWGEVKAIRAVDGTWHIAESEVLKVAGILASPWKKSYYYFRALGPGLITGASDDDPSGIGTYSSTGAKFGLGLLWMAAWLLPMMMAIQEACARIGIVTNHGLAGVLQKHYKKRIVASIVFVLIVANIINIGADLGAMAKSLQMLIDINFYVATIAFAGVIILLEIFIGYHIYVKILKWLAISVLAYIATAFIIKPDWQLIAKSMIIPRIKFTPEYIFAIIAIFGTSITPYLFFWQTSEEVEENKMAKRMLHRLHQKDERTMFNRIGRMRTDVGTGMVLANVVFFFIIVTTSQVLFENGIFNIDSAEQAALALRPLAGDYAYLLFAFGIIGTGLLAVPILAGSGAYALAETMKWREGLEEKFSRARGFYLVIITSIVFGLALNFFHINPITALYYSAFLNGVISIPLLIAIMIVSDDKRIMGRETNPVWVRVFGWLAIVFISSAVIFSGVLYFT
ncbi:MAG: divalent metal cation transporter [Parcubacteria group bacterium]|jgi:NRAMP (natural resistance-associated macrophage protein)-like metal ion transporter